MDSLRELTRQGMQEARNAGAFFRNQGWPVDAVLASPYRRAWHTALLFCEAAGVEAGPREEEFLASGMTVEQALSGLRPFVGDSRIVIVGHQPDFGELVCHLTGLAESEVRVGKGSLWELKVGAWQPGGAKVGFYRSAKDLAAG
jgi:phosphohistidine phosphatase